MYKQYILVEFNQWIPFYFTQVEPNFYSKNHLFLGKTLLQMKKMDEAKMWLEKAVNDNPEKTADDKAVCIKMGLFMIKTRKFKLHLSDCPPGCRVSCNMLNSNVIYPIFLPHKL